MKRHITLLGGIERPSVTYRTFKRSANNFRQFANARKTTVDTGLTFEEARRQCERFNENRDARQNPKRHNDGIHAGVSHEI